MSKKSKWVDRLLWLITLIATLLIFLKPLMPVGIAAGITILSYIIFSILHGTRRMGWRNFLIFFLITFVVSWSFESLSIHTGFPFGHYYYSDILGAKLGDVPLMIMPAYFGMGYISWELAHLLTDHLDNYLKGSDIFRIPAIAAFIMVMWDLSMDPISSTIQGSWVWRDGGSYWGVPLVNFLGWYLCVYTIFQLFALYQQKTTPKMQLTIEEKHTGAWYQLIIYYFIQGLAKIWAMFIEKKKIVTDPSGVPWRTQDIYSGLAVVILFTMTFVTIIAWDRVKRLLPKAQ
ncbi:carotenoid biosynthesis protein [Streptococcus hyointestinalis]|uniref:carotenoid biosynthesis protein n=1 Tax=Streptococcus hyointestinalis TaxID=1337 RepID=UPI0035162F6F